MKRKAPRQTICNEPTGDPKTPICGGKLKQITPLEPEVKKQAAPNMEVYRCQICRTLYEYASPYAVAKR